MGMSDTRTVIPSQRLYDEIAQMNLYQLSQTLESLIVSMIKYDDLGDMDEQRSEQLMRVIDELIEQIGENYTDYRGNEV